MSSSRSLFLLTGVMALAVLWSQAGAPGQPPAATPSRQDIDFNRHIRPILSAHCFACHGPDEKQRKARLRLDRKEDALAHLRQGGFAIVPGKPAESELLRRVASDDPAEVMPPVRTGKRLTPQQVALLRKWVEQGAPWAPHWAFVAPRRPPLPPVADKTWPRNPIDHFVLARLEAEKVRPSPEAGKTTLLRRVSLDLTGLPPTPAEVKAFLADSAPDAYEKVVDHLLRSPRYGEHLARFWLDAARYADTHGLHADNYRAIWPYRDWVINAFNQNLPYDRFLTEQLAGDLLPNPTPEQLMATGFCRCHVTSGEAGALEEEYQVLNAADRVETFGTVFLGLTVGCARCHDHKYDPLRTREFYQLFAFFNSLDGPALDRDFASPPPTVRFPTAEQAIARKRLDEKSAALKKTIAAELSRVRYDASADENRPELRPRAEVVWLDDDLPAGARAVDKGEINQPWAFVAGPKQPVFSGRKAVRLKVEGAGQVMCEGASPGLLVGLGDTLFAHVHLDPANPPKEVVLQWQAGDWKHRACWGADLLKWDEEAPVPPYRVGPLPATGRWVRLEVPADKVGLTPGVLLTGLAFSQHGGTVCWDRAGLVTRVPQDKESFDTLSEWLQVQHAVDGIGLPEPLKAALNTERGRRTPEQKKQLRDFFLEHAYSRTRETFEPLTFQVLEVEGERAELEQQFPTTLVFKELKEPRPAHVLKRGEYDQKGERVGRDTPAFLPPLPADAPRNRLGLARWLTAPEHPLTARVAVNRLWQQCFGAGLVRAADDFGVHGEPPSHPELLDFLAVQFREDGWDFKKTLRRIVLSATYRQSSIVPAERRARDPANRLLARGPSFRLDAEALRDQALAVSGLLVEKQGGPSVKPPQPPGLWEAVGDPKGNTGRFVADTGPDKVHRRSLYTFWKRTAPPPQLSTLDAPSRERCLVRRERTNTPLQALLLLNEPQFIEAARALAEKALRQGGTREEQLGFLFLAATGRPPEAAELAELKSLGTDHLATYRRDPAAAKQLIAQGETRPDARLDPGELAALTLVANVVLNLDEVLNKN